MLHDKTADQESFMKLATMLTRAAEKKTPISCLGGEVLGLELVTKSIEEMRACCEFPIPPGPDDERCSASALEEEISAWTREDGPAASQSNAVAFSLCFLRMDPDTLTLVKVLRPL